MYWRAPLASLHCLHGEQIVLLNFLVVWLVTALGLWLVTRIVPGVRVRTTRGLWLAALVLGLVNVFIRPLLWVLTLPLTVLSFGLFALVVNALMIQLTAWLVSDLEVDGFGSALLAALIMVLLALVVFIATQWLAGGTIHWIYFEESTQGVYL
jgi:putative membrane protein